MPPDSWKYSVPAAAAVACAAIAWYLAQDAPRTSSASAPAVEQAGNPASDLPVVSETPKVRIAPVAASPGRQFKLAKGAIPNEMVLQFPNAAALQAFLEKARRSGAKVLGVIPQLNAVRLAFANPTQATQILALAPDSTPVGSNNSVAAPRLPNPANQDVGGPYEGFGTSALPWLGVNGDNSNWGAGVTVAVLDTGVSEVPGLDQKTIGQLDLLPETEGAAPDMRHGTAMASIIAGDSPDAPGVAPAAQLFSVRVLDETGGGDGFTVAQGIIDAVDHGARVLSMSMGSPDASPIMDAALDYALSRNVAIVAATGNDGIGQVSYPANYPGVVAVTAVDANGVRAQFANFGPEVTLAAPGVGVSTPWTPGTVLNISGTSASVPFVSGAIAAVLSNNPGMSEQAAVGLLTKYADDAGAPGPDPMFGNGILDIARVMSRNTPGIYDAALA